MILIDTSVLVRYLRGPPPGQSERYLSRPTVPFAG